MELREIGATAVFEHEAVVAAVVGFPHRGVDADLRRHAGDDELLDVLVLQDGVQVGGVERALARLVDDRLAGLGIKLGNDVVAGFASHQNAAHRAGVADRRGAAAANFLGRRQIGEVGPMALARMENGKSGGAPRRQKLAVRLDGAAQLRDVVAEHFAKAAGLEKIALHVDDQERAMLRRERELVRFGRKVDGCVHAPTRAFGDISSNSPVDAITTCAGAPRPQPLSGKARTMPAASTRIIAGTVKRSASRVRPGL